MGIFLSTLLLQFFLLIYFCSYFLICLYKLGGGGGVREREGEERERQTERETILLFDTLSVFPASLVSFSSYPAAASAPPKGEQRGED